MPSPLRKIATFLALSLTISCVAAPTPEELLDVGFRSPTQAFRTFQTAIAGDHIDMGYRCFTDGFKALNSADDGAFSVAWKRMLDDNPGMRYISEAEIVSERQLDPQHVELVVELDNLFVTVRARILLAREDYFEAWRGSEVYFDGYRSFAESIDITEQAPVYLMTYLIVPEGKNADEVTEIRIGQEWHIDSFEVLGEELPLY